jgi:hypothetical protein
LAQPNNIALVVPGIMASCLRLEAANRDLWTEDFRGNYKRLLNPDLFKFVPGQRAQPTAILKDIRLPVLPLSVKSLYGRVLKVLNKHSHFQRPGRVIEFPYDWREDLVETARLLGDRLRGELGRDPTLWDSRITAVTHSMGGLVVQIAIANGHLPVPSIARIVHIASPFMGSANSFKSLYDFVDFPLLEQLYGFSYGKDTRLAKKHLRDAMKTFPSVYQLLPPENQPFIDGGGAGNFNPLSKTQTVVPSTMKAAARKAHDAIARSIGLIHGTGLVYVVRGVYTRRRTDERYQAFVDADDYKLVQPVPSLATDQGDGTVVGRSADYNGEFSGGFVRNVIGGEHAYMCNHPKVAELVGALV